MTITGTHGLNIFKLWVLMAGLAQEVLNQEYGIGSNLTDAERKYCDNVHILVRFGR